MNDLTSRTISALREAADLFDTPQADHPCSSNSIAERSRSLADELEQRGDFDARFAEQLKEFGTIENLVKAYSEAKMRVRELERAGGGHCKGCGADYVRGGCEGIIVPACIKCGDDRALLCPTCAVMVNKETP